MKKLLENKRIIVFILVFTISFGVLTSYKQKEVQAIAIVDDILFWTLGTLVLSTGVVALSDLQVKDMGKLVYDNFKLKGYTDADLMEDSITGTYKILKIGNALKSVINYVVDILPIQDKENIDFIRINSNLDNLNYSFSNTLIDGLYYSPLWVSIPYGTNSINVSLKNIETGVIKKMNISVNNFDVLTPYHLYFEKYSSSSNYIGIRGLVKQGLSSDFGTYKNLVITGVSFDSTTGVLEGLIQTQEVNVIPYSNPLIKEGYDSTLANKNLPYSDQKQGYIPIPSAIPNLPTITGENPLTWDNVKTDVKPIESDTDIDWSGGENEPDPNDDDTPDLWKWLTRILRFLFSPVRQIKNVLSNLGEFLSYQFSQLLTNIKNIPNVFRDFFSNLIDKIVNLPNALKDFFTNLGENILSLPSSIANSFKTLLSELFMPTVAIAELFSPPVGSGFSDLLMLFNFNTIFDIDAKPYEFETNMKIFDLTGNNNDKDWHIEIKIFDNKVVKENLSLFRNVLSYSLLISVIYFIVYHFLPKRDMD